MPETDWIFQHQYDQQLQSDKNNSYHKMATISSTTFSPASMYSETPFSAAGNPLLHEPKNILND